MKLGVRIQLLTFCSQALNFIFLALGLSLFFCGIWILFSRGNLLTDLHSDELRTVGAGLMMIGAVVGVVSVIGCLSAAKDNRFLLLTYLGFLLVLFLGQLFVTLLLLINKHQIERTVDGTLDHMILQYNGSSDTDTLMDNIQHYEECCGLNGSSDWLKNSHIQSLNQTDLLPCSCFNSSRRSSWCSTELLNITVYNEGCQKKVTHWLKENILTIAGMNLSLMFVQVVLFVLMAALYRSIGTKDALKRIPLTDADHAPLGHAPEEDLDNGEQNYSYIDTDDGYTDLTHPPHLHDYPEAVDHFHANNQ
uniref:leukocyte surface antigen CD53-like n=2 Tax=Semicossyphus pulcher TaxID=241346 RepID=UPI0037E9410B